MSDKIKFELLSLLEAIEKVQLYSQDFLDADEIWDIINNKLIPLKNSINTLVIEL